MGYSSLRRLDPAGFARISVSGSGGVFQIRIGAGELVDTACVREERGGLRCDCGRQDCQHIESLVECGFFERPAETYTQAEAA